MFVNVLFPYKAIITRDRLNLVSEDDLLEHLLGYVARLAHQPLYSLASVPPFRIGTDSPTGEGLFTFFFQLSQVARDEADFVPLDFCKGSQKYLFLQAKNGLFSH